MLSSEMLDVRGRCQFHSMKSAIAYSDAAIRAILEEGIDLYRKHQVDRPDWQHNIEHESPDPAVIARFSGYLTVWLRVSRYRR